MSDESQEIRKVSGRPGGGAYPRGEQDYLAALSRGRTLGPATDPAVAEMRHNRRVNASKTAQRNGSEISFATGRPTDPMFYWKQNNLPYDVAKIDELKKIRAYCRLLYQTHPIIASAIDVYAKYPLTGMELVCKDNQITEFYTTLFFDQLNYEEYLVDVGKEHWTVGEAWPLGSFNETLGVWEDDELIPADDVDVIRSPFLKEPRFQMALPETIRQIIKDRSPKWEFEALMRAYPELKNFTGDNARMPVSNILLKQIRFKADPFHPRGIPILMRGFRAIMQEEMLNAAQDAVASRLYTPLILAKLGASATDLGTEQPWIPTDDDLGDFEEALDAALAADFRVLTHHFAVSMESVFGRENMPNLDQDFERLTDRILQVFGLSKTMLSGASSGETYAADAMNRDLISQLLTGYQRQIKRFFRERALVVAEAQEHYDYEVRGGKRYPIMEEVLEVDEETGQTRIVEQPKLLVPDLQIKAMTMKDEQDQRQFYEALRESGVPISMKSRMVNVPLDLEEETERVRDEQVQMAVAAQETRKQTYLGLKAAGLPIADDLRKDFEPQAQQPGVPESTVPGQEVEPTGQVLPTLGNQVVNDGALVPTWEEQQMMRATQEQAEGIPAGPSNVVRLPTNQVQQEGRTRQPESDEMRAGMPKPASLLASDEQGLYVEALTPATYDDDGKQTAAAKWERTAIEDDGSEARLLTGPKHIGLRRHAILRDAEGALLPLDGPTEETA